MFKFNKKEEQPKDLKQALREFAELKKKVKEISEQNKACIQKVGIVRYNPFSDTGSDQSFSIALLDSDNNGMVITSLYSRDGNRVYAKPVNNAKSEYSLSEEENKAIKKANEQRK